MRDAVKLGKLEDDELLGHPEDSDDDMKQIMDLINQGEVENVGPNLPNGSSSRAVEQGVSSLPPPKARNKTSRFKVNRGGAPQPTERTEEDSPSIGVEPPTPVASTVTERRGNLRLEPHRQPPPSPPSVPDTPLADVERSTPKLPPECLPIFTEELASTPISRKHASSSQLITPVVREPAPVSEIVRERTPIPPKTQAMAAIDPPSFTPSPSMIISSPSFVPQQGHNAAFPPMIIDSPSFAPPRGITSMPPMIVDSPDFPPPKGAFQTSACSSAIPPIPLVIGSPSFPVGPRNTGPPRVMSSRVVERSPAGVSQQPADVPSKRVSRFAAERR